MQIHGLDSLGPLRELPLIQPTKRTTTTISETTQKKITDRNREAEKRQIQVRGAAITLISNRSGCRKTPTARPTPPPQAEKKKAITSAHNAGNRQIHTDFDQPRRGSRCPASRHAGTSGPTGAISRSGRRSSEVGAGRG